MTELLTPAMFLLFCVAIAASLIISLRLAKDPSFGVLLLAFFLPFERIPSIDLGGFTFKINHLIGGLTLVFWLLAVLFTRRKIAPNPLTIPLVLFFFSLIFSGLNATNTFRHLTVYISLLIMLGIYLAALNGLTSKAIVQKVVGLLFVSVGLMSLIGIYQFFGDLIGLPTELTGLDPGYTQEVFSFPRVHSFSKEPLYYANYLFIPLGVGLALFFAKLQNGAVSAKASLIERLNGPWLLPLIILIFINFFLTLSRGAFIAFVPFALIFAFFYAKQIFTFRNIILGIIVLVVSLSAVYNVLRYASNDALERFLSHAALEDVLVQKQGESGYGRLITFEQAYYAWRTSPVVGIGLGNFGPHIERYPEEPPLGGWQIVNNEYLELLTETGVVGLSLWLIIILTVLFRSIKAYRTATDPYLKAVLIGLIAALVAISTQYNFFSTLYIIHIWVLLALIVGVQNIILTPDRLPKESHV